MDSLEKLIGLLEGTEFYVSTYEFADGSKDEHEKAELRAKCLIKHGVVALPCKEHDYVYVIEPLPLFDGEKHIHKYEVLEVSTQRIWVDGNCFDYDDIGKTVFFTQEEAERGTKKIMGEENYGIKIFCKLTPEDQAYFIGRMTQRLEQRFTERRIKHET